MLIIAGALWTDHSISDQTVGARVAQICTQCSSCSCWDQVRWGKSECGLDSMKFNAPYSLSWLFFQVPIANQGIWLDCPDLRDHRAYLADHPGASTITTAQVSSFIVYLLLSAECCIIPAECCYSYPSYSCYAGWRTEEADWCCSLHRVQFQNATGSHVLLWI